MRGETSGTCLGGRTVPLLAELLLSLEGHAMGPVQ